jgi:hypothetical protein
VLLVLGSVRRLPGSWHKNGGRFRIVVTLPRSAEGVQWPRLGACAVSEWLLPTDDLDDSLTWLHCWQRWIDERHDYLLFLGLSPDDAMVDSVGDYPRSP